MKATGKSSPYKMVCHHCGVTGHISPNCPKFKVQVPSRKKDSVNFVFETDIFLPNSITCEVEIFNKTTNAVFDTGCSTIIVRDSLVPPSVRPRRMVTLFDYLGVSRKISEVRCHLKSNFINGWANAVVAPLKFTDVLIGLVPGVCHPISNFADRNPSIRGLNSGNEVSKNHNESNVAVMSTN